jgi:superfamily I DNA/RNA helicase
MSGPTDEQTAAADAFRAGDHLVIQAGAGTGKTTTLTLLASTTQRRGRYIAYNKAIATDAATKFPPTVTCKTAHALAFAALGHRYTRRLNGPRQPSWKTGNALGITKSARIGDREVTPKALSHTVLRTVASYCHSADNALARHHVPCLRGVDAREHHAELAYIVLPFARKAWADLQHPDGGVVRFEHDHYLKIWALTDPTIEADFLLLDEAQDTNPVVELVFPPKDTSEHDADGRPIPEPVSDTDARLAYVAVTRARHQLDLGGLSWIHDHHDGNPPAACS